MTEFVRVKDPDTKHEFTVTRQYAEGHKLPIIDKPALDSAGRPLTSKPNKDLPKAETKTNDAPQATLPGTETPEGGKAR